MGILAAILFFREIDISGDPILVNFLQVTNGVQYYAKPS